MLYLDAKTDPYESETKSHRIYIHENDLEMKYEIKLGKKFNISNHFTSSVPGVVRLLKHPL